MQIADSVVLVTGASRGIGAALVRELAARGPRRIYAAARRPETLPAPDPRYAGLVVPLQLDVTDPVQVSAAAASAPDVTLLVNNAGSFRGGSALEADLAGVEEELAVNVLGTLRVTQAFAPVIEANGGGAVVNLLSVLALGPNPRGAGYCASKAAADSVTRGMRPLLAQRGIAVHGVYPAYVDTDMTTHVTADKADPAEVAAAIADGILLGTPDIVPDQAAAGVWKAWNAEPRSVDKFFAG